VSCANKAGINKTLADQNTAAAVGVGLGKAAAAIPPAQIQKKAIYESLTY